MQGLPHSILLGSTIDGYMDIMELLDNVEVAFSISDDLGVPPNERGLMDNEDRKEYPGSPQFCPPPPICPSAVCQHAGQ